MEGIIAAERYGLILHVRRLRQIQAAQVATVAQINACTVKDNVGEPREG